MLNETTLLHRGDITVTDAWFMIDSQTFAIRGITSVRATLRRRFPSTHPNTVFKPAGFLGFQTVADTQAHTA